MDDHGTRRILMASARGRRSAASGGWSCGWCLGISLLIGTVLGAASSVEAQDPAAQTSSQTWAQEIQNLLGESQKARDAMDFPRAFAALEEAQALAAGSDVSTLEVLLERTAVLGHSGAMGRAKQVVSSALKLLEGSDIDDLDLRIEAYCRLARIQNAFGQHEAADQSLDLAASLLADPGPDRRTALIDSTRSKLAIHRGEPELSLVTGLRALEFFEAEKHWRDALSPLSNVAYALQQLGRWSEAEARYEQVIEVAWKVGDQYALEFGYCNRGEVRRRRGEVIPAIEDLKHAIEGFEKARGRVVGSAEERAGFLGRQVSAYERLILTLANEGRSREAFEVAERFHGRSFLELLDPRTRLAATRRRPEMHAVERPWLRRMAQIHLRLSEGLGPQEARALHSELERLEGQLWTAEADWQRQASIEAAWVAPPPPRLTEIQAGLRDGEALIAYWSAEERLFIWAMGRDWFRQSLVPVTRSELDEALATFLEPLRSAVKAQDLAMDQGEEQHLEVGRQLHRWLIEALPSAARRADRWLVVPDGHLHHLPFGALVAGCEHDGDGDGDPDTSILHRPYGNCSFLGLQKAISYAPAAGVWAALRQRAALRREPPEGALLALAPSFEGISATVAHRSVGPLEFNGEEVQRIGRWFPQPHLVQGSSATESHLKEQAHGYRRLHLATHGLVDDRFPLGSGVLLAPDDIDDGLLQVEEVVGLDLRADLVTLSACRSGRGRLGRGEGFVGLGQAFLFAGASSLVLSLWDVDDRSTPILMETFYQHLSQGARPAEALRSARRALFEQFESRQMIFRRREVSFAHPRFWAAFVVLGDG